LYWIATTAGQRAVTLEDRTPTPIIVRDFNPYSVRVASGKMQQGKWIEQTPNGNRITLRVEDSVLAARHIFEEDVRTSLPYVEIVTQDEYDYEGVMIDDQRILGFKVRFDVISSSRISAVLILLNSHFCSAVNTTQSGVRLLTFMSWGRVIK
jgi:hypothetical protein